MRPDRIVKLIIAAAVIAFAIWIARQTYWDESTVPTPMTGEAATNPYYSVEHLLGDLGMHTRRINSLRALPTDAVVLASVRDDNLFGVHPEQLESWVESGGRLIVSGAVLFSNNSLQTWSGVTPSSGQGFVPPNAQKPMRFGLQFDPEANCAPMTVQTDGTSTGESLTICTPSSMSFHSKREPAWALQSGSKILMLRIGVGDGEFTVWGPHDLLSNKALTLHDHAEVLLEAAHLQRGDTLLILSPTEAVALPVLLWRYAAPAIVFLAVAVALLIWRHLPRFGPPVPVIPAIRRSLAEQIRANARFAWRTRKLGSLRGAVRRSLDEAAMRQIAGYAAMNVRQQSDALAAGTGIDAAAINAALTADGKGNMNEHRASITLLEVCRRILIKPNPFKAPSHER